MNSNEETIEHSGVRGMRWGVRKNRFRKEKIPQAHTLSDAELRARLNRMQMEQQYRQLTTPQKMFNPKREAANLVLGSARVLAQKALTSSLEKYGGAAVSKLLSMKR